MSQRQEYVESLRDYIVKVGVAWRILVIEGFIGGLLWIADFTNQADIPRSVWVVMFLMGLAIAPFQAFHQQRLENRASLATERRNTANAQGERDALIQQANRTAERREVRKRLAEYMATGRRLLNAVHEAARSRSDVDEDGIAEWGVDLQMYLRLDPDLGPDFEARASSAAGLPIGTTTLLPPYSNWEGFIQLKLARLGQFLEELARA